MSCTRGGSRSFRIEYVHCKSALVKSLLPGYDYVLNPYVGCLHGCIYCYVPDTLKSPSLSKAWGNAVSVKENLIEVLLREMETKRRGTVGVSSVTDPYQPVEREHELTRRAIDLLSSKGFHVSLQSKSAFLLRDLDIVKRRTSAFDVGFTITSLRSEFQRLFEPKSSTPEERVQAFEEVSASGVETWVFLGPLIPGFNDDEESIREVVRLAKRTGSELIFDYFRPKPLLTSRMSKILPDTTEILRKLTTSYKAELERKVIRVCKEEGLSRWRPAFSRKGI